MREIEIERLLHWAYRDELPKRGLGDVVNSWDGVAGFGELLTTIDEPGFPVACGFPHADALTIARAVRGLHEETAIAWRDYREIIMGDMLGIAPVADPIPGRVFSEVALIETFARMGMRPKWNIGRPIARAVIKRGIVALVGECRGRDLYTLGSHCPLQYGRPEIDQVAFRRAEYLVWRGALDRLVGTLRGWTLRECVPGKATAPALPWLDPEMVRPAPIGGVLPAWRAATAEVKPKRKRVKRAEADAVPAK